MAEIGRVAVVREISGISEEEEDDEWLKRMVRNTRSAKESEERVSEMAGVGGVEESVNVTSLDRPTWSVPVNESSQTITLPSPLLHSSNAQPSTRTALSFASDIIPLFIAAMRWMVELTRRRVAVVSDAVMLRRGYSVDTTECAPFNFTSGNMEIEESMRYPLSTRKREKSEIPTSSNIR